MINLLQMQDKLKDMSDRQLASEMQSGMVPQYLVLSELQRRQKIRQSAKLSQQGQQPQTTVADEIEAEFAPNEGVAALPIEEPQFASGGIVSFSGGGKVYNPGDVVYFKGAPYTVDENGKVMYGGMRTDPSLLDQSERIRQRDEYSANNGLYNRDRPAFTPQQGSMPTGVQTDSSGRFVNAQGQNIADLIPKDKVVNGRVVPANVPVPTAADSAPKEMLEQAKPAPSAAPAVQAPSAPQVPGVKVGEPQKPIWETLFGAASQGMPEKPTSNYEARAAGIEELRKDYKRGEKDNANEALIAAGLAMMSGTSPYALTNIGTGGLAGLKAYATGKKDQRDLQKDILAAESKMEDAKNSENWKQYEAASADRAAKLGIWKTMEEIQGRYDVADIQSRRYDSASERAEMQLRVRSLQNELNDIDKEEAANIIGGKPINTEQAARLAARRQAIKNDLNRLLPGLNLELQQPTIGTPRPDDYRKRVTPVVK